MPSERPTVRPAADAAGIAILAGVYFIVAYFCLKLASVHPSATPVWPPVGLAVGAVIAFGRRYAIAVFLGTFTVSVVQVDFGGGGLLRSEMFATMIGVGNMLEALAGGWLVNRYAGGRRCLDRVSSVFAFLVFGALLPPALSASFGVLALTMAGVLPFDSHGAVTLTWYTGNVVGIITVAPIVIWLGARRPLIRRGRLLEPVAQLFGMLLLGWALLGVTLPESLRGLPQIYMVIPLVLWAALRLGQPVILLSMLLFSAIAVAGSLTGNDFFEGPTPNHSLIYLQIFIGIITVMALAVSALVTQLRTTNEGLEDAVEERTVRLQQLLREKDEYLSVSVHELQSPLAGLRNLISLLRRNPDALRGSDPEGVMIEMEEAADNLLGQVREMLTLQRLEEKSGTTLRVREDFGDILEGCVRAQRPTAVTKDISIALDLPGVPIHAVTSRESVEHILGNLLSNAVKFTPPGRNVRVRLVREHDVARFEIQDEGPGIPSDQVAELFGKFQRSAAKPTAGEASTGLGLYIVGKLVDKLGGEIRCRSVDGEGACFVLGLPAERQLLLGD